LHQRYVILTYIPSNFDDTIAVYPRQSKFSGNSGTVFIIPFGEKKPKTAYPIALSATFGNETKIFI